MSNLLRVQIQESDLSRRVLSPLVEDLDEDAENRPPILEYLPDLEKDENVGNEKQSEENNEDSLNNNEIQEDGFLDADDDNVSDDDEYFTEDSISIHTDPDDYDTDLEIDTECMLNQLLSVLFFFYLKFKYMQVDIRSHSIIKKKPQHLLFLILFLLKFCSSFKPQNN